MRPPTRLNRFAPIFPVADLRRALAHYQALGFETLGLRGGRRLRVRRAGRSRPASVRRPAGTPAGGGEAYLYVEDADALFEEWGRPGIAGTTRPPGDTPYQLREGSHLDPDGNLIRFGSPLPH